MFHMSEARTQTAETDQNQRWQTARTAQVGAGRHAKHRGLSAAAEDVSAAPHGRHHRIREGAAA
jgi:hypothetical protein